MARVYMRLQPPRSPVWTDLAVPGLTIPIWRTVPFVRHLSLPRGVRNRKRAGQDSQSSSTERGHGRVHGEARNRAGL
ncbi:unnamed protein product [Ixodes pacificus]